jgi:alpha-beta hydrolase superfamily lysophospholipase
MTQETGPSRRVLIGSAGALLAAAPAIVASSRAASATPADMWRTEYAATKQRDGETISLAVYRRRAQAPVPGEAALPVLFLVHGSSNSALSSFDLTVHTPGDYSLMDVFAGYGFDVWTMDHEGYGKSLRTSGNSDIASGVADLRAAADLIRRETGQSRINFCGESSGAIRAAAFAAAEPDRTGRLVLTAFTYTGRGSPTLTKRAEGLEFYRTHNRRPRDLAMIRSIFTRDKPGTSDPAVADAIAKVELPFGDSVPTGTYLDMTANLPLVDPAKILSPVLLMKGEFDGIATVADLVDFFEKLPNGDRQLVIVPGAAHSLAMSLNRAIMWHVMRGFLTMPPVLAAG